MAKTIAIEWDTREVRMLVGSATADSVTIEQAVAQELPPNLLKEESVDPKVFVEIVRTLAKKAGVHGGDVIVGVGRSRVEMRSLQVPQADTNDLPDMVKFAAMRQFANVGDTWPMDFVRLPQQTISIGNRDNQPANPEGSGEAFPEGFNPNDMIEVLAIAISPSFMSQIRKVVTESGFHLTQVGLRPMASGTLAAAASKSPIGANSNVLLVDVLVDEADMAVLEKGHVTFIRTVRLAVSEGNESRPLHPGEIRRTLMAAMSARPGLQVDRIILWGNRSSSQEQLKALEEGMDIPVELVDPFEIATMRATPSDEVVAGSARFASLAGLLMQKKIGANTASSETVIDFVHPRERVEEKPPIVKYALAAGLAFLFLGSIVWWYRSSHAKLDRQIAALTSEIRSLEEDVKIARRDSMDWQKIEAFMKLDINWLDELVHLSENALPPEKTIFGRTTFAIQAGNAQEPRGAGVISTRVALTSQQLSPELENALRNERHRVSLNKVEQAQSSLSGYGWVVDPKIVITPDVSIEKFTTVSNPSVDSPTTAEETINDSEKSSPDETSTDADTVTESEAVSDTESENAGDAAEPVDSFSSDQEQDSAVQEVDQDDSQAGTEVTETSELETEPATSNEEEAN